MKCMRIIGIFPLKKAPSRENGVRFWTKVSSFCMAVAVRDRISTAGWAVLSGYVDHACGRLASGQLSTCHETVEPRWDCRGSDRGEPDSLISDRRCPLILSRADQTASERGPTMNSGSAACHISGFGPSEMGRRAPVDPDPFRRCGKRGSYGFILGLLKPP